MTTDATHAQQLAQPRAEVAEIEAAMRAAVQDAVLLHKRAGLPMATWQNGQVVWIPADQIPHEASDYRL